MASKPPKAGAAADTTVAEAGDTAQTTTQTGAATGAETGTDPTPPTDDEQGGVDVDDTPDVAPIDPATPIPMTHPDNGACELYPQDENGHWMVPANEAATMIAHGFVVVED